MIPQLIDGKGQVKDQVVEQPEAVETGHEVREEPIPGAPAEQARKFYFDGGQVSISAHLVYELDANGRQLRVVQFTDYTAEQVRTLYTSAADLRDAWADPEDRAAVIAALAHLGAASGDYPGILPVSDE